MSRWFSIRVLALCATALGSIPSTQQEWTNSLQHPILGDNDFDHPTFPTMKLNDGNKIPTVRSMPALLFLMAPLLT